MAINSWTTTEAGHGWVITSHSFMRIQLLIQALNSILVQLISLRKKKEVPSATYLTVNTVTADNLVTQGARASAAIWYWSSLPSIIPTLSLRGQLHGHLFINIPDSCWGKNPYNDTVHSTCSCTTTEHQQIWIHVIAPIWFTESNLYIDYEPIPHSNDPCGLIFK